MPSAQKLLQQIQLVIDRHGKDHPNLKADLEALRSDIEKSSTRSLLQYGADAARIASWVKWIIDFLP